MWITSELPVGLKLLKHKRFPTHVTHLLLSTWLISASNARNQVQVFAVNHQSFVDHNSKQPATKSAFVFEPRRIARCCEPTILHGIFRSFSTAEHTTCYEVEEPATAGEPSIEYCWVFLQMVRHRDFLGHVEPQALTRTKVCAASASLSELLQGATSGYGFAPQSGVIFARHVPVLSSM